MNTVNAAQIATTHPTTVVLDGMNFSGRTDALKKLLSQFSGKRASFVPPEVDHVISGLGATVGEEIQLGRRRQKDEIDAFTAALQMRVSHSQNPMTLSGGEKVQLAILCAYARGCAAVALDVVLEQLDPRRREAAIGAIRTMQEAGASVFVVDNRRSETWECYADAQLVTMSDGASARPRLHTGTIGRLSKPDSVAEPLSINRLRFGYQRGQAILHDIQVTLLPGRVYHLSGENGTGKSTLAKLLVGRLQPWSGEIRFGEVRSQPWRQPGRHVAYHFQDPDVQLFTTSVRSEIESSTRQWSRDPGTVSTIARQFGLAGVLGRHPFEIDSYVLRKRLALAATIACSAPWLILDEPTLGQDDESAGVIARIIDLLASQGRGIMVISHSPDFIARLNPSYLTLRNGVILQRGG